MEISILFEDNYCVVVNKPPNLLVHHAHFARNIEEQSLVDALRDQLGMSEISPVHRLDRKTSGILLFAKAKQYVSSFQGALDSEVSQKKYLALLRGFTPETGTIDSPVKNENKVYKEAKTSFRTLIHIERNFEIVPYPTQRYSVVEFTAHTGRYHQLRQHANKIAHPIINDPKHGNRHHNHYFQDKLNIPYLFLHAYSLMLQHPFTHEKIDFQQETPGFWTDFLQDDMQRLLQKV